MKEIIVILFVLITQVVLSQNLVPNGSFENYSTCPTASGQLTLAINWINPSSVGTPDYLNICSFVFGIGNQSAKDGNALAGIWAYCSTFANYREYLQIQLTNPLINSYYLCEYYIKRSNWSEYACNNISCLISNSAPISSGSNGLLNANPQVTKFNNPIINDTLNWIRISSVYQAAGGENYITIGNFKNDALTTYSYTPNVSSCVSYYFIDDVSVEHIITPQWQYRDTTVYLGDSVLIGPAITGLNINWYDAAATFIKNDPGIYVKPALTTTYLATETFNNATYNHTVTVTVLAPNAINEYEQLQNSVTLFPNPTIGNINLQFDKLKSGTIDVSICDVTGNSVYQGKQQVEQALTQVNLNIKSGIYFVKIINSNETVIKKLVVQD